MALAHVIRNSLRRLDRVRTLRRYFNRQPLVSRACPLCGTDDARLLIRGDRDLLGISTSQCGGCGFVFSAPYYPPQVIADFYRENYRTVFKGQPDPHKLGVRQGYLSQRAVFFQRWLEQEGVMPRQGGLVLDVGCGEGSLLRTLGRARPDLDLSGVEPTRSYARHVATGGAISVVADIADLPPRRRFDLVVLVHVLEHVYDPMELLARIGGLLADHGKLYVDVPDVIAHESINDLHLAHCNHFSAHTLGVMLEQAGFSMHRVASHRPPTLPPSIFAIAGLLGHDQSPRPIRPDPEARSIAQRVAAIDVGRIAHLRWRLQVLLESRRASRAFRGVTPGAGDPARADDSSIDIE